MYVADTSFMLFIIVFVINNHINTVQSLAIYVNVCSSLITKSPFQAFRGCRRWSEVKGKNSKGFFPGFSVSLLFISRHFPLTKTADIKATNKLNFERPCNERPKDFRTGGPYSQQCECLRKTLSALFFRQTTETILDSHIELFHLKTSFQETS